LKRYSNISNQHSWENIIPEISDENVVLLNQAKNNFVLAWGNEKEIRVPNKKFNSKSLQFFIDQNPNQFFFGYLSYSIKNKETRSTFGKENEFRDLLFFIPKHIIIRKNNQTLYFGDKNSNEIDTYLKSLIKHKDRKHVNFESIKLTPSISEQEYISKIEQIKDKIQAGIIYEMNFCVKYNATFKSFDPYRTYLRLNQNALAPFSSFIRDKNEFVLSASPERFLRKDGSVLISQPIKGTAKRGNTSKEDLEIKNELESNTKERAENIMIVDLVRNDLSKIALKNSVKVDELCKAYTFKTVHQLISSISCKINKHQGFSSIIESLFPMGSMTGAPKISAIENIDQFEDFDRNIYSGSIGYIEPNGNFDFNVVIRTIKADLEKGTISSNVGGAITIKSDPKKEYQECLLKLKAIQEVLC